MGRRVGACLRENFQRLTAHYGGFGVTQFETSSATYKLAGDLRQVSLFLSFLSLKILELEYVSQKEVERKGTIHMER